MSQNWDRLFPTGQPHRFHMGLRRCDAAAFWSDSTRHESLWQERCQWLSLDAKPYRAELPAARNSQEEARAYIQQWSREPEPDWVLLMADDEGVYNVVAGEVVFPSSWSLPEKLGLPLPAVHAPVPGLENQLGHHISMFLSRLNTGEAWERENWGLCASAELNQHPARRLPEVSARPELGQTWMRLERQFLLRLPMTGGILFGIRVSLHRLDQWCHETGLALRLAEALETMNASLASYKGLTAGREELARTLRAFGFTIGDK